MFLLSNRQVRQVYQQIQAFCFIKTALLKYTLKVTSCVIALLRVKMNSVTKFF